MNAIKKDDCNFRFDEMVWRSDSGLVDQAITELTAIRDDVEFERQIFLIRIARQLSGLGNERLNQRETSSFGRLLQILLVAVFRASLLCFDRVLGFCKINLRSASKLFIDIGRAPPNK